MDIQNDYVIEALVRMDDLLFLLQIIILTLLVGILEHNLP